MTRRTAALVFLVCAVPRAAALAVWPPNTGTLYYELASGFLRQHRPSIDGELTALIEPFYPLVLAGIRAVFGDRAGVVAAIQVGIASLGGVLLFGLVLEKTARPRTAWIAALLYAVSPYLVRQSVAFMEVTVAVVLLMALCSMAARRVTPGTAFAIGLLLGAIVLTRFSFAPIALGTIVWLTTTGGGPLRAVLATLGAAVLVLPWMACTASIEGTLLPPRVGENLFVSTGEWAESIVPRTNVDVLIPLVDRQAAAAFAARGVANPSPADRDRLLRAWTWAFVRDHPFRAARLKLRNAAYALQPRLLPFGERRGEAGLVDGRLVVPAQTPRPRAFEIGAALFQAGLTAGAAAGLWKRRRLLRHDDALVLLIALSVFAVAVVFFPTSRLLAPMTFVLMFYAAVAFEG